MKQYLVASAAVLLVASAASAADLPLPVEEAGPVPTVETLPYDWTGVYAGLHGGYGFGDANADFASGAPGAADLEPEGPFVGGQLGVNWQLQNGLVLGAEGDASVAGIEDSADTGGAGAGPARLEQEFDVLATARGRLGYAFNNWLPFVTGGAAWARGERSEVLGGTEFVDGDNWHFGWTAGAGVEYGINDHWSAKLEYRYTDLGDENYAIPAPGGAGTDVDLQMHSAQFGVNFRY